ERREEFQRGMQGSVAIAQRDSVRVAEARLCGGAGGSANIGKLSRVKAWARGAIVCGSVFENVDSRPRRDRVGDSAVVVIAVIRDWDDRVQPIIGAAQPDEEEFLTVQSDGAFGQ